MPQKFSVKLYSQIIFKILNNIKYNQYNEKEHYLMKTDDNNPSNNYFEKYSNI